MMIVSFVLGLLVGLVVMGIVTQPLLNMLYSQLEENKGLKGVQGVDKKDGQCRAIQDE